MDNIIKASQFSKSDLELIFRSTNDMKKILSKKISINILNGLTVTCLFYQPSTRTFASFLSAAQKMGAHTIPIQGVEYSSVSKGESFEDTIKTLSYYSDGIVLRHPEVGAAERAVTISNGVIINAGDGPGEHPTQALLDLYTIFSERKNIEGSHIVFFGDINNSRTIHSLAKLLSLYNVKMSFVGPKCLKATPEFLNKLDKSVNQYNSLSEVIESADILYVTRVQKEYLNDSLNYSDCNQLMNYEVTPELMVLAKKDMLLMHPFPRVKEIPVSLDSDSRAAYFKQIENGLYVRAALLGLIFKRI